MNRMTGIVLMIAGVLVFFVGVIIYNTASKKTSAIADADIELKKAVKMAIADGVLTLNERKIIKELSIEKGVDYDEIIKDAEKQMLELKTDSETELIDQNKRKGDDFEKFIVQKFNQKYFNIKGWAGDKYVNGFYANTTPQPDLQIELIVNQDTTEFSVECKWRQKFYKGGIEFAKKEQLERYKSFEKEQKHPVFIAIGIGGKSSKPEHLYIVPLRKIDDNFIPIKELNKYEKEVNTNFFFNADTKELN